MPDMHCRRPLPRHKLTLSLSRAGVLAFAIVAWAIPATAQITGVGQSNALVVSATRGTDVAFDPKNQVYLVVGANGPAWAAFADTAGQSLGVSFRLDMGGGPYTHFPRVIYCPDLADGTGGTGAFVATWTQDHGSAYPVYVHARILSWPARGVVTNESVLSSGGGVGAYFESAPAIAYSPTSRQFLVSWAGVSESTFAGDMVILARFIDLNAQPVGPVFQISGGYGRDPGVAWNPNTNEFFVWYSAADSVSATTVMARIASNGALLRRNVFDHSTGSYIGDIAFNPVTGRFVTAWYVDGGVGTKGAEFDGATGDLLAMGPISKALGTAQSMSVTYNPVSGTFLLAAQGYADGEVHAIELSQFGAPHSAERAVTASGSLLGSFYPRSAVNPSTGQWNTSFAYEYRAMVDHLVATTTTGGGTTSRLGTPQTPPPSTGGSGGGTGTGCTTADPFIALGGGTCVNGGWLPPGTSGGGSTTPGGCTTASPGTGWTCVNGGWLPPGMGGTGSTGGGSTTGGCTTASPGTGWTCVNGGWLPPGMGGTGSTGGSTGGCTTASPGTGWTCVNGGWLPPGMGGTGSTGGSTGSCTTASPGTGWTCVNGGWLPPGMSGTDPTGGSSTGSCTTASPGTGWTCVNGGWLPPGMVPGSTGTASGTYTDGTCTTPDPFTAIGGGVCVAGGWRPRAQ